ESMYVIFAKVGPFEPDCHWWYLSCVCNMKVIPDGHKYYCERCNRHVLMVNYRYMIRLHVSDPTGSAAFVMHDRMAAEFFGMSCSQMLKYDGKDAVPDYVPESFSNMVGKCYLFMIFTKVSAEDDADKYYPVSKVTDDDALIQSFKRLQSIE
ncbi:replication factor-A carboxy-terminal domain protein, partial [Trifolium pratense]